MKSTRKILALFVAVGVSSTATLRTAAQTASEQLATHPSAAYASTSVPALIPYSGTAVGNDGKPLTGEISITFLVFKDDQGGDPVFTETQSVTPDAAGRYKVQLGASFSNGLPPELFANGDARWLEVQIPGQAPQPRSLLVSVPYAMKAADATTLGGLPVSAFVLAGSRTASNAAMPAVSVAATTDATGAASAVTTTGGTSGNLAMFSGAATVANSSLFEDATGVGIGTTTPAATLDVNGAVDLRGTAALFPKATATATAGADSFPLTLSASAYNSTTKAAATPTFAWQAEPTGNNTAAPSATLNLLSSTGGSAAAETGFYINPNGTVHFASAQTFPGTGDGTITGVTAGNGLTGGGTSGAVALAVDATKVPLLAAANKFTGNQTIDGTLSVDGKFSASTSTINGTLIVQRIALPTPTPASGPQIYLNTLPFLHMAGNPTNVFLGLSAGSESMTGSYNVALGNEALMADSTGYANTALGALTMQGNTTGLFNTAVGGAALNYNTTGQANTALGTDSLDYNVTGEGNTAVGYEAGSENDTGSYNTLIGFGANVTVDGITNATAIGEDAAVSVSNALVLGAPGTNVGIGTSAPTQPLVIQSDDNGAARNAAQQLVIQGNSDPNMQLLIGYRTAGTAVSGGNATIQATWAGHTNTGLLLQPNGGCVCVRTGTNEYSNPLVVGQGQGAAVADGWNTFSSRRFKTNIQTLPDALEKVERLRGVSYDLKATGKHEIGVIAEEVGAVVPEIVQWESNGKDARSVDYTRLTALLIEATKQQQAELDKAMQLIKSQQAQIHRQAASMQALTAHVNAANQSLQKVKQQLVAPRPVPYQTGLVASR